MIGERQRYAVSASLRVLLAMFAVLVVAAPAAYAQCGGLCLYEIGSTDTGSSAAGAGCWRMAFKMSSLLVIVFAVFFELLGETFERNHWKLALFAPGVQSVVQHKPG